MEGIHKRFGPTRALAGVSFEAAAGEVHALVGENGAGKSTLMKVLSGAERPDAGLMTLAGRPYRPAGPLEARRAGVAMIFQELALAPHLDVTSNVLLGLERHSLGFVRRTEQRCLVAEALALLDHPEIHPDTPVGRLGPGARQLVEIARALVANARVLVLDEPTSSLTARDAERLFTLIRRLAGRGVAVIYISHFLEEVRRVADRCTVLRDGRTVAAAAVAEVSANWIVERMVGRSLGELYPRVPRAPGGPVLRASGLAGSPLPRSVDFTLHRGEILGVFGLVGAGRTEALRVLFGLDRVAAGSVFLRGRESTRATPASRVAEGVGLLSEDRKHEGLALGRSLADNITLSRLSPYAAAGWLRQGERRCAAADWLRRLGVRCRGPEQRAGELSGGNQQKVALARLLHQGAEVLLLDEPTRGIDVGSKADIYALMGGLAGEGRSVLFVSSYLPELLGVCDRLAVMARGRLGPARPVGEWTGAAALAAATGEAT